MKVQMLTGHETFNGHFTTFPAQVVRLVRAWPVGEALHRGLRPLLDSQDAGPLIVTHLYLLLGFSLPVWLYPLREYRRCEP